VERAVVLSCLATARYYDDNPQRRAALCNEALALTRLAADTATWLRCYVNGRWRYAPPTTPSSAWLQSLSC
jgi:hypothetical protein